MANDPKIPYRYTPSFYISISTLFVLLILLVSGIISWNDYSRTSSLILRQTDKLYTRAERKINGDLLGTINNIKQTVALLATSSAPKAVTIDRQLALLPLFTTALRGNPQLSGLQVGFATGEYFIIRPINSSWQRHRFNAPESAIFGLDSISGTPPHQQLTRIFLDRQLREVTRKPPVSTNYDPRTRIWFTKAAQSGVITVTKAYYFYFTRKVGTTISLKAPGTGAVIAADLTLDNLSGELGNHLITPHTEIALIGPDEKVIAYPRPEKVVRQTKNNGYILASLAELDSPVLTALSREKTLAPGKFHFIYQKKRWIGRIAPMKISPEFDLRLLMLSPETELLEDIRKIRSKSAHLTFAIILLSVPVALLFASGLSSKLKSLAKEAGRISNFDFSTPIRTRSVIREVHELADAMNMMKSTISRFLDLLRRLTKETDFNSMLRRIAEETVTISGMDGAVILFTDHEEQKLVFRDCFDVRTGHLDAEDFPAVPLEAHDALAQACDRNSPSHITIKRAEPLGLEKILDLLNREKTTLLAFPLHDRTEKSMGLLILYSGRAGGDQLEKRHIGFLQTFSGFSAISLESSELLAMQKKLLESFIQLLAGAIDSKSPYTGGHCQRVPVITKMLAEAACADKEEPFRDFDLSSEEWEELHIAAWLHDCGKVTTPEYVVDKATKLETIYDRIHEVRMRFEVMKKEAVIRFYEHLEKGEDRERLKKRLDEELQQLDEDFAFVAECNTGGEFMAPEKIERLQQLARRTWTRTLDDRLGISWEELQRKQRKPAAELPVQEPLLADRVDHLITRRKRDRIPADNPWGFKLEVPEHLYNRGELYNLCIERGTLNAEERFKINDHIVQTIIMLDRLPFPRHLRRIPEIAGGHHETMIGTGYPKKLTREQMSLTARMMVIADIFEALTASDRPYKKAKTLSEALRILSFMCRDGHIDPDLFKLFLQSGVYLRYAEHYLAPEQIDNPDIEEYLACTTT